MLWLTAVNEDVCRPIHSSGGAASEIYNIRVRPVLPMTLYRDIR